MTVVLAELLPNINELFDWKGIFSQHTLSSSTRRRSWRSSRRSSASLFFWLGGRARRRSCRPGIQNVAEMGYEVIEENVSLAAMGEEGKKWTPFFATLFFWIFFINIWSVVPGIQFPATSRLAIPLVPRAASAGCTFIVVGFMNQGPEYFFTTINPSGVPLALKFLVVPIEFFSKFLMRPFSLAVRLFANMTAGHVLLTIFAIMTNELLIVHNSGIYQVVFAPLPFLGLVAFTGFEILVAVLQAYIFTILTAVYIAESIHPEH